MAAIFVFPFLYSALAFADTKAPEDSLVYFGDVIEYSLGGNAGWSPTTVAPCDCFSMACTMPSSTSGLYFAGPISALPALLPNLQVLDISSNNMTLGNTHSLKLFNASKMQRQKWINVASIVAGASILISMISCCCYSAFIILRLRRRLRRGFTGNKKQGPAVIMAASSNSYGEPKLAMFGNNFSYAQVLDVTNHFLDEETVFSRGRYGVVYKASFSDGTTLAILRLLDISVEEGVFRKEVEVLSKVKHPNLTILRGYYAGPPPNVRLLVYDYMPNCDLASLLVTAAHVLSWPMRHLIALGVARGLSFLHTLAIVHGDVNPQNVLFDADVDPHLAGFGLDKLCPAVSRADTIGYVSPEVARSGQATKKGDVYSFGVMLLELLTGKRLAVFNNEEEGVVKWLKRTVQSGQVSELLGPGLRGLDPYSTEWEEFLLGVKVALLYTLPDPIDRPPMFDVVSMLEGCPASSGSPPLPTAPCPSERSSVASLAGDNDDRCRRGSCGRRRTTSTYQSLRNFLKKQVSQFKKKKKRLFLKK